MSLSNHIVEHIYSFKTFVNNALPVIKELEDLVGNPVVPLFFGVHRFINASAVDSVYDVLRELGSVDGLSVVLFSGGGNIDEAYLLAMYLQDMARGKLTVYVPRYAKSAATLLACGGDEIVMLPITELGPIDPVLYDERSDKYVPLQSILELIHMLGSKEIPKELAREILDRIPVIELGDYKRAVEHNIDLATRVLSNRMFKDDPDKAREVAEKLVSYKQHGAAITYEDAKEIGLKVRLATKEETEPLWSLHKLFKKHIIESEYIFKEADGEPIEFKLGKGIILTIAPSTIIKKIKE